MSKILPIEHILRGRLPADVYYRIRALLAPLHKPAFTATYPLPTREPIDPRDVRIAINLAAGDHVQQVRLISLNEIKSGCKNLPEPTKRLTLQTMLWSLTRHHNFVEFAVQHVKKSYKLGQIDNDVDHALGMSVGRLALDLVSGLVSDQDASMSQTFFATVGEPLQKQLLLNIRYPLYVTLVAELLFNATAANRMRHLVQFLPYLLPLSDTAEEPGTWNALIY